MQVADLAQAAACTGSPEETVQAAASRMWGLDTVPMLVVADGRLLGTLTERDVLKAVARGLDLGELPVSAVMTSPALTVSPEATVEHAAALLAEHRAGALPVVRHGELRGLLTAAAVLRALLEAPVCVPAPLLTADDDAGEVIDLDADPEAPVVMLPAGSAVTAPVAPAAAPATTAATGAA